MAASARTGRQCELAPGLRVCRIVNGLWQVADMERAAGRTKRGDEILAYADAMLPYVDAGQACFDMADHYGSAEDIVGVFRSARPDREVQVFTKWCPAPGPVTLEGVQSAVDRSLLRTRPRVDLLQLHWWHYHDPGYLDALRHLQGLRESGRFGHLGVTNFDTSHLCVCVASGIRLVSNQVCFSLLDMRAAEDMTKVCLRHGISLLAFGTLAGGLLTDRWLGKGEPSAAELGTWSLQKYKRFVDQAGGWDLLQMLLRTLRAVADRHGCSIANVAARYILDQPAVAAIIVGVRLGEREHLRESDAVFELELTEADVQEIQAALGCLRRIPGDCGDEYRRPPYLTASGDLSHHLSPPRELPDDLWGLRRVLAADSWDPYDGARVFSGSVWEELAGFCRALRRGDTIYVSGTTATNGKEAVAAPSGQAGADPEDGGAAEDLLQVCCRAQTAFVLDKIDAAIRLLGGRGLSDVVRTRVFVPFLERDWEPVAREHGRVFGAFPPANTLVGSSLVGHAYLVEVEAEARVRGV